MSTLVNALVMLAIRPSGGFLSTTSDMIKWEKTIAEKKIILKKENWKSSGNHLLKRLMRLIQRHIMGSDGPSMNTMAIK